jgi:hypothetical protein
MRIGFFVLLLCLTSLSSGAQVSDGKDNTYSALRIKRGFKDVYSRLFLWYQAHPSQESEILYPGLSYFPQSGGLYPLNFSSQNICSFGGLSSQIQVQLIADSSNSTLIKVKWPEEENPSSINEMEAVLKELEVWLLLD